MFPEITRDEVFRIETPRLWLRWPVAADADALATVMAQDRIAHGLRIGQTAGDAMEPTIDEWRAAMEAGQALHLVLTPKAGDRRPIGILHAEAGSAVRCRLAGQQMRLLGAEAWHALRDMLVVLGVGPPATGTPPMAQQPRRITTPLEAAICCMQA